MGKRLTARSQPSLRLSPQQPLQTVRLRFFAHLGGNLGDSAASACSSVCCYGRSRPPPVDHSRTPACVVFFVAVRGDRRARRNGVNKRGGRERKAREVWSGLRVLVLLQLYIGMCSVAVQGLLRENRVGALNHHLLNSKVLLYLGKERLVLEGVGGHTHHCVNNFQGQRVTEGSSVGWGHERTGQAHPLTALLRTET